MPSFDPAEVRKAVAEFTPRRPQKFHDLLPAKEVIAELRRKGASYRAVAELLTQHCLPISKTAVAAFCHEVLGEILRPHRRSAIRKKPTAATSPTQMENSTVNQPELSGSSNDVQTTRGPRIAQVRILKSQSR